MNPDELKALANEARLDAKAFRENTVYDSGGDPIRLTANADRLDAYASALEQAALRATEPAQAIEDVARWLERLPDLTHLTGEMLARRIRSCGDYNTRATEPVADADREADDLHNYFAAHAKGLVEGIAQGRAEAQAEIVAMREAILEEAARLVERRMEQRFEDYGTREPDTNATYYEGRAGETYEALDEEDEAIATAIRALAHRKEGA